MKSSFEKSGAKPGRILSAFLRAGAAQKAAGAWFGDQLPLKQSNPTAQAAAPR
jgi:hypothetical protein